MDTSSIRLGWKAALSNTRFLGRPYKATFALTYACNSKCRTCGIWSRKKGDELALDEIRLFARRNAHFSWIAVTGGEPFLRGDLPEIAAAFKEHMRGLHIFNITTNGLLPRKAEASMKKMLSLGIPRVVAVVSLDGPKALHDSIRGVEGSWERAVETFARLKALEKKRGFRVFFGYTASSYNAGAFSETIHAVRRLHPHVTQTDFHVNLFHASPHYYANERSGGAASDIGDITEAKRGLPADLMSLAEKTYASFTGDYIRTRKAPLPCKALKSSVFIDPYGRVYPCTIFDSPLGSLRETGYRLSPLLDSEKAKKAASCVGRSCPQCWTPCEAYQSIIGNAPRLLVRK